MNICIKTTTVTIRVIDTCPKHGKLQVWSLHFPKRSSIYGEVDMIMSALSDKNLPLTRVDSIDEG